MEGKPFIDVDISLVAKVGTKEYIEKGFNTKSDGDVTFSRCFGGKSFLRVYHDGDSTDCKIEIDWKLETNKLINLGDIVVNKKQIIDTVMFNFHLKYKNTS